MKNNMKRKKVGATLEVTPIVTTPFFHPPWLGNESRLEMNSYVWPPTLHLRISRGQEENYKERLPDSLAGEGLQGVTYKSYVTEFRDTERFSQFIVFEPTARGFIAAWLGPKVLNMDYMTMNDVDEDLKKVVGWVPIVSDVEKDITTEKPLAPAIQEELVKDIEQQLKDIRLLALSPLQRTELQERLSVLRDEKFCNGFVEPEESFSEWEQMVKRILYSNHEAVNDLFDSSIPKRQSILKNLFALNEAQTAKRSLRAIKELTSFLNGANNCGGGENNLITRVIGKEVEMELKTLDSLAKVIQQNKSAELTLEDLDLFGMASTRAFLAKQHKQLMKHLHEHVAKREACVDKLLQSRLDLVFHVRNRPEASGVTNFLSTRVGKVVQEAHKSILADKTPKTRTCEECVICLGELGGALNPPVLLETSGNPVERKRGCFLPCMHANACILCCEKIWEEGPQVCPVCKAKLTEAPKPLFL